MTIENQIHDRIVEIRRARGVLNALKLDHLQQLERSFVLAAEDETLCAVLRCADGCA